MPEQMLMPEMPEQQLPRQDELASPHDVRTRRPVRNQAEWVQRNLEQTIAQGHPARMIWAFIEQLDLTAFYAGLRAVADGPGRPATDPQVLLGLWLLATVDGVGSARRLGRLCEEHDAYRWMCGGVPINYHMLSDFRVAHSDALDGLLSEIIAALMAQNLVELKRVSQDGMRVRASAGAGSFRRKGRLKRCLAEARKQVERLAMERESPDPLRTKRERAARERAAREREERIKEALLQMPAMEAAKERQKRKLAKPRRGKVSEARVSTTDPEARVMRMPDGGYRPAYNLELAEDTQSGVIVGVSLINTGDEGQAAPMAEQVEMRTGRRPEDYLMDGSFAAREDITALERKGITVYAPVSAPRNRPEEERYKPHPGDSLEVASWRARMSGGEAKAIYRERASSAEWANAQLRQHGISSFNVRGITNATSVALLAVIAHNLMRWAALTA